MAIYIDIQIRSSGCPTIERSTLHVHCTQMKHGFTSISRYSTFPSAWPGMAYLL